MKKVREAELANNLIIVTTEGGTVYRSPLSWFPTPMAIDAERRYPSD
jgi:hypothetical protein